MARLRRLAMPVGGAGSTPGQQRVSQPRQEAHVTLAEHAAAFEEHGPVRDIYVLDTTSDDWQRLLDHLRTSHHRLDFRVGGQPAPLPPRPAEIFAHNAKPDVLTADLHVDLGGYQIVTFFWDAENIEFTLFPELIDTEQRYQALMAFPVELATVTGKPAILTTEPTQPRGLRPWFVVNPDDPQLTFNP
jgi:hypothetical protein